jgi:hypothetical protein
MFGLLIDVGVEGGCNGSRSRRQGLGKVAWDTPPRGCFRDVDRDAIIRLDVDRGNDIININIKI